MEKLQARGSKTELTGLNTASSDDIALMLLTYTGAIEIGHLNDLRGKTWQDYSCSHGTKAEPVDTAGTGTKLTTKVTDAVAITVSSGSFKFDDQPKVLRILQPLRKSKGAANTSKLTATVTGICIT